MNNSGIKITPTKSCIIYVSGKGNKQQCISGYAYTLIDNNNINGSNIVTYSRFSGNITFKRSILIAIVNGIQKAVSLNYNSVEIRTSDEQIANMIKDNWILKWKNNNWKKMNNREIKHLDLIMILYSYTKSVNVSATWVSKHSKDNILKVVSDVSKVACDSVEITSNEVIDNHSFSGTPHISKGSNKNANKRVTTPPSILNQRKARNIEIKKRREKQKRKKRRKKNKYKV